MTRGGLIENTRIIHVTTLADKGEGSLRQALSFKGPRVIVFDVGGIIRLESDLRIGTPYVTIAGQSAPPPGVVLLGNQIRIKTHDVVIQHISVFPVLAPESVRGKDVDAISVYVCGDCGRVGDIRLENLSLGWATDEVIGLWGRSISNITVRNSLIAEGLDVPSVKAEPHSMGMLIGAYAEGVEVVGSLFVSNKLRNPVVGAGASAFIANNYVSNPGTHSAHVYGDRADTMTRVALIGNVVRKGPDSDSGMSAVQLPKVLKQPAAGARLYASDNHCCSGASDAASLQTIGDQPFVVAQPPVMSASWTLMPAAGVRDWVLHHAGSRPADRTPTDQRIVRSAADGGGKIIADPAAVNGYGPLSPGTAAAVLPVMPTAKLAGSGPPRLRIEAWLCLKHFEVGGPPTPECSDPPETIRQALSAGG